MKVRFWGTRGSLPAPFTADTIRGKIACALEAARGHTLEDAAAIDRFIDEELPFAVAGTYGSNTSCVQIENPGGDYIICDCGSGLRDLAMALVASGEAKVPSTYHIFMSHLHWDHLQGFPFFVPAYIKGNRIIIHTYHPQTEATFREQMSSPVFPVPFDSLAADIEFDLQEPCTPYSLGGFEITAIRQNHPGISYGYRFAKGGKSVVYSTDSEHKHEACGDDYPFLSFFRDADLLIFDAQYTMADATFTKANWGHSSNVMGVELAARSHVKTLAIFHHEPTSTDAALDEFLFNTRMYGNIYHQEAGAMLAGKLYPKSIILAYDGLTLEL